VRVPGREEKMKDDREIERCGLTVYWRT